jgi:hypothetical protein
VNREQLRELARPFPSNYIRANPSGGGSYVNHAIVVQRLLMVTGPFDFSIKEVLRGDVAEIVPDPQGKSKRARDGAPALSNAVVGCIGRLGVTIDGTYVAVEEVGDCEDPHNWPHDGARLKDAASDAIKRCAARIGLGLHLWSSNDKGGYFLFDKLTEEQRDLQGMDARGTAQTEEPEEQVYAADDPERPFESADSPDDDNPDAPDEGYGS